MQYKFFQVKDVPIYARIADTPQAREQGLMGVEALNPNEGCLFCFGEEQYVSFWMKNCKVNLQAVTLSKTGKIIDIFNMEHTNPYYIHKSSQPVSYVLEMPENFFTKNGILVGEIINLEY